MKRYLGDAVYAEWDGDNVILTTEDGYRATNTIVLEPVVTGGLETFIAQTRTGRSHPRIPRSDPRSTQS